MRRRVRACVALAAAVCAAGVARAQEPDDLERIRAAIAESRARVEAYEQEQRGLLDAIDAIDESSRLLRAEAARARRAAARAREALAAAEATARDAEERLAELERAMAARANALHRTGELGAVRLLFAANGLEDFFRRVQTLRRLVRHDGMLIERHREQTRQLEAARRAAADANAAAAAADAALASRTRELDAERARKRELARRLGRSRARVRGALVELESAARALEATVAAWDGAPAPGPAAGGGPAFASLRGALPDPVEGTLRGDFGRVFDRDTRTATFRKGVAWEAPVGTPVRAVAAGSVRYAGRFLGYGNVVILDHGDDYFTVSAHLDAIGVAVGDAVAAGDEIGRVGETGSLEGPQLYFELRRGAEALDPSGWLAALGTAPGRR